MLLRYLALSLVFYIVNSLFRSILSTASKYENRVIHGKIATYGEFPFLVAIVFEDKKTLKCSGTLITEEHVLTAAHCYGLNTNYPDTFCFAGDIHSGRLEGPRRQTRKVIHVTLHPESKRNLKRIGDTLVSHDLAILKVERKFFKNKYVETIPLSTYDLENGDSCISIGFGITSKAANTTPSIYALNYAKMASDKSKCVRTLKDPSLYCIYNPEQMVYYGDSGSPLINARAPFKCFGILAHFDTKCKICAVYTNVRTNKPWLLHELVFKRYKETSGKERLGFLICYLLLEVFMVNYAF